MAKLQEAQVTASKLFRQRGSMFLLAAIVFASLAAAQSANTGELKGAVMDASGAVLLGASVSIQNVQTGLVTPTTTNASGLYDVPFLTPGTYTITFAKDGFRSVVRKGIV